MIILANLAFHIKKNIYGKAGFFYWNICIEKISFKFLAFKKEKENVENLRRKSVK